MAYMDTVQFPEFFNSFSISHCFCIFVHMKIYLQTLLLFDMLFKYYPMMSLITPGLSEWISKLQSSYPPNTGKSLCLLDI